MILDSLTNLAKPAKGITAHGQPAPIGEFSGKALEAVGTTFLRIFLSEFPEAALAVPALGAGAKI